jgi:hypothetical protein
MGRRRTRTRVEGEGRFFMREERELSHIVRYARVVFVCGVFLQLLT